MIREADLKDLPLLLEMGQAFLKETSYRTVLRYNEAQLSTMMTSLIQDDDGLLLVSDRGGVDGMMGMYVYEHPFSGDRMAAEAFWWMNTNVRGGSQAVRLLRRAEEWVREQGVPLMHMVAPDERVGRLYERLGYRPMEVHFYKSGVA
jgi:GNAT superfamily N-acetyltransferase